MAFFPKAKARQSLRMANVRIRRTPVQACQPGLPTALLQHSLWPCPFTVIQLRQRAERLSRRLASRTVDASEGGGTQQNVEIHSDQLKSPVLQAAPIWKTKRVLSSHNNHNIVNNSIHKNQFELYSLYNHGDLFHNKMIMTLKKNFNLHNV